MTETSFCQGSIVAQLESIYKGVGQSSQGKFLDFILSQGQHFNGEVLEKKPPIFTEIKKCFANSVMASASRKIAYVEGYYVTTAIGMAFPHAWNFHLKKQKVIDHTTAYSNIKVLERFGLIVPPLIIKRYIKSEFNGRLTPLQFYFKEFHL